MVDVGAGSGWGAGMAGVALGDGEVVGSGGRSSGGTESEGCDGSKTGGWGMTGVCGKGGRSRGGRLAVGVGMVGAGVEGAVTGADGVAVPPSLAIVSSASFMRRSVAFWKISSSLTMVVYTLGRSGSAVLLTISMRLILIGSRRGESINKFTSDCLFNVSGITTNII